MKANDINEELLQKYVDGALSDEEETEFDLLCMHNDEALRKLQEFAKANLLKSFTSQYADIGRKVFAEKRKGYLQFSLSSKIIDAVESGKRAVGIIDQLVSALIGVNAIPQIAGVRSDDSTAVQDKAIESLSNNFDVLFKRDSDNTSLSVDFDSEKNTVIFKDVVLSDGPASKLMIEDSSSSAFIQEIYVDDQSGGFSVPVSLFQQDILLTFQVS